MSEKYWSQSRIYEQSSSWHVKFLPIMIFNVPAMIKLGKLEVDKNN